MATIGQLVVELIGDTGQFQKQMDSAAKKMQNVGKSLTSTGKMLSTRVTLPLTILGGVAVMAASDLEESMNKVMVVFGDTADEIISFSEGSAKALGMTQEQVLEAAGTFGNLFTAMEIGMPVSSQMSQDLVTLAADLASFNNMDPTEVLDKLRSGLVGEVEPLRTLGVNLNQAMLEAKALEMGLIAEGDALDAAAKAQASFAIIMEQTAVAQGDFARTSDGLANQMRIVKAQAGDMAASLGTLLLPYVQKLVTWVSGLIEKFQNLSPGLQKAIVIFGVIAAAIGPVLMIVGTLISAIGAILPVIGAVVAVLSGPVLLVIGLVVGAVALLAMAWKNNWGGIQEKTAAVVEWIKSTIGSFLAAIQGWWTAHGAQVMAIVQALWDGIMAVIDFVLNVISTIVEAWMAAFRGDWTMFGQKIREVWDMLWDAVKLAIELAWKFIVKIVSEGIKNIVAFFKGVNWKQVGIDLVKGIAGGISSGAKWVINAIKKVAKAAWNAIKGFFGAKSPSRLMMGLGEDMMLGWAMGISDFQVEPIHAQMDVSRSIVEGVGESARVSGMDGVGGRSSSMIVYDGIHVYGVEDGVSLLEQLEGMGV